MRNRTVSLTLIAAFIILAIPACIFAKNIEFEYIDLSSVSRFNEDRIAYQRVEAFIDPLQDDSLENLLILKDSKMYLIRDGYDDKSKVIENRLILTMENKLIDDQAMWVNKLDGKVDYIQITDRRVKLMEKISQDFVEANFGNFFRTTRDTFVKKHVEVFRELMRNRKESEYVVERKPLPKPLYINAPVTETKFAIKCSAKTLNGRNYFCEDADGDGITETFAVSILDGFSWGTKCGPNIIFIYKNKDKGIEGLIGKLANEAYYGTTEEEENIRKSFPSDSDMTKMIDDLIPKEVFVK